MDRKRKKYRRARDGSGYVLGDALSILLKNKGLSRYQFWKSLKKGTGSYPLLCGVVRSEMPCPPILLKKLSDKTGMSYDDLIGKILSSKEKSDLNDEIKRQMRVVSSSTMTIDRSIPKGAGDDYDDYLSPDVSKIEAPQVPSRNKKEQRQLDDFITLDGILTNLDNTVEKIGTLLSQTRDRKTLAKFSWTVSNLCQMKENTISSMEPIDRAFKKKDGS